MSGNLPSYILKGVSLHVDTETKLGQLEELSLPSLEATTVEMRNGGMIKPREVRMGFNLLEASFKLVGVDPAIFQLFARTDDKEFPIIGYGYLQDEDGTSHAARVEMQCEIKKADSGTWKEGEVAPTEVDCIIHAYRLIIDDDVIADVDDFTATFGGVSVFGDRADALRIQ